MESTDRQNHLSESFCVRRRYSELSLEADATSYVNEVTRRKNIAFVLNDNPELLTIIENLKNGQVKRYQNI